MTGRRNIVAVAGTNFLSACNPVFFCTLAALWINLHYPFFERQVLNVIFVSAVYTSPLLVTGFFAHYLNTRFSTRNVIVFSKAAEIVLALLGALTFWIPGRSCVGFMLAAAALLGAEYSIYRPALKIYTAGKSSRLELSRNGAAVEAATFAGIVIGTVTAVLVFNLSELCHSRPGTGALLSVLIAMYSLMLASRLEVDLPANSRVRFAELPRRWIDTLRL